MTKFLFLTLHYKIQENFKKFNGKFVGYITKGYEDCRILEVIFEKVIAWDHRGKEKIKFLEDR